MPLLQLPPAVYSAGDSIPYSFPIEIRGEATTHGYDTGCPQQATDPTKATGTVSVVLRVTGDTNGNPASDLDATELTDLPVTALEAGGTTLEFSIYAGMAAGTYQMQGDFEMPDPDNDTENIKWQVTENFIVVDKRV